MYAIDVKTNKNIIIDYAKKGNEYFCLKCDGIVIVKNGKIKKKHFSHKAKSNCIYYNHSQTNESIEHFNAKCKLAEHIRNKRQLKINLLCPCCETYNYKNIININYSNSDKVITEYLIPGTKYRADIAVINNDKIKYIFEIKYSHSTSNFRPEPWYEINSNELESNDYYKFNSIKDNRNSNNLCKSCKYIFKIEGYNYDTDSGSEGNFTICKLCYQSIGNSESDYGMICGNCKMSLYFKDIKVYNNKPFFKNKYGIELKCKYDDKDIVKKYGAIWNKSNKKWCVPKGKILHIFNKWLK